MADVTVKLTVELPEKEEEYSVQIRASLSREGFLYDWHIERVEPAWGYGEDALQAALAGRWDDIEEQAQRAEEDAA